MQETTYTIEQRYCYSAYITAIKTPRLARHLHTRPSPTHIDGYGSIPILFSKPEDPMWHPI